MRMSVTRLLIFYSQTPVAMKNLVLLFLITFSFGAFACSPVDSVYRKDQTLLKHFFEYANKKEIAKLPINEKVVAIGRYFLETPYVGGTLDINPQEELVVNLREFDCVTFVDNVIALARLDKYEEQSIPQFQKNLQEIRYRNGKIVDYTSRLHYSSDWLYEMTCLNFLEDITKEKGGIPFPNKVSFISQNWKKYPALIQDSTLITKIIDIEKTINGRAYYYIPKEKVLPFAGQIKTGDIILITTKKKGLDTAHVGIAIENEGQIYLLHASVSDKKVSITTETLPDYLQRITSHSGIMIGRLINFKSN